VLPLTIDHKPEREDEK
jgi:serine/threonine protein phosphatase PrpC